VRQLWAEQRHVPKGQKSIQILAKNMKHNTSYQQSKVMFHQGNKSIQILVKNMKHLKASKGSKFLSHLLKPYSVPRPYITARK
jgi:hypothetical protein